MNVEKRNEWIYLGLILGVGFLLRSYAIDFGLPYLYHADEPIVVNHALAYGSGDLNPHFFNIPPLVSYVLFIFYGIFYICGRSFHYFDSLESFSDLFFTDPTYFYLLGRLLIGVIFSTLTIALLYRLSKKAFSKETGLVSALFLAVNFLHVQESHYIYVDIPLVMLIVYTLLKMCLFAGETLRIRPHLLLGALIGVSTAIKYNGAFLFIPYLAMLLFQKNNENKPLKKLAYAFAAGAISVAAFLLLNPFAFLDLNFFIQELAEQNSANSGVTFLHHFKYSLLGAMGLPALIVCFVSFCLIPLKFYENEAKKKIFILWTFVISYYLILVFKAQPYSRYVLPLVPILCLIAGDLIIRIQQKIQSKKIKIGFVLLAVLGCLVVPLSKAVAWDLIMGSGDTRTQAKRWIEEQIPTESAIAIDWDFYMPRLNFSEEQLEEKIIQIKNENAHKSIREKKLLALINKSNREPSYRLYFLTKDLNEHRFLLSSPVAPYDLTSLKTIGIRYVATVDIYRDDFSMEFYNRLKKEGRRIAFFSPYTDTGQNSIDKQPMTGGPFLWDEIKNRKSNGPVIVIYEI
jgi:hypothetical protein